MGANQAQAERTGIVLDVAVPLVVAGVVGAARVMSIRSGRIALAEHEAMGGHTILKHVGKTEAELRARLVGRAEDSGSGIVFFAAHRGKCHLRCHAERSTAYPTMGSRPTIETLSLFLPSRKRRGLRSRSRYWLACQDE